MLFKNQTVVITGGTRGIGKHLSYAFLKQGANVVATYKANSDAANKFQDEMIEFKNKLWILKSDVSSEEDITTLGEFLTNEFDSVEVLINNSGIKKDSLLALMNGEQWDQVLDTNLKGTYLMCKMIIPIFMKKKYGRIINISSLSAYMGLPGQTNYSASKAGQIALSKSLAKEVAKKGITVNSVLPGFIETEMIHDMDEDQKKAYKKQIPMRRFGKPEEVSSAITFLASPMASYITGSELVISGGLS